jgi:P27 family predicted phage terminase small subunit
MTIYDDPEMPGDLQAEGRREWRRLLPILRISGRLSELDSGALGNVCRLHELVVETRAEIRKQKRAGAFAVLMTTKTGYSTQNPLLIALNQQISSYNRALSALGMTPASRARMGKTLEPMRPMRPPWATGEAPRHGWAVEAALCGMDPIEADMCMSDEEFARRYPKIAETKRKMEEVRRRNQQ